MSNGELLFLMASFAGVMFAFLTAIVALLVVVSRWLE